MTSANAAIRPASAASTSRVARVVTSIDWLQSVVDARHRVNARNSGTSRPRNIGRDRYARTLFAPALPHGSHGDCNNSIERCEYLYRIYQALRVNQRKRGPVS